MRCPTNGALTFQIVTKRIGNVPRMLPPDWGDAGCPNVWLLITVVNQEEADRDIPKLLRVPAGIHGLSMEPLLGPVDLRMDAADVHADEPGAANRRSRIDWIISGGESGADARAPHPEWVRSLRDQCVAAGAAFFFKPADDPDHQADGPVASFRKLFETLNGAGSWEANPWVWVVDIKPVQAEGSI